MLDALAAGTVVLLACAIVRMALRAGRRRKQNREILVKAGDKLREEALDRVLVGERPEQYRAADAPLRPFDVKYDFDQRPKPPGKQQGKEEQSSIMIQLTEQSELSTRNYMFHIQDRLTFGSKKDENDIVLKQSTVSPHQCEIFCINKNLYVKNLGRSGNVILMRRNQKAYIEQEAIEIEDGDSLHIGNTSYKISIIQNM